ncbi:MAG: efflux RND transporter permease subunit [Bacteriovoracaceae bacterium]|jgi:multidrug efflux pump subunit AcrB|nr:efflux RND transporter permease subunit [Bacteriovoracaceae bacterium]
MNKLVRFFLDNYKLTIILSFMMVAFGFMGVKSLKSESYPSVNFAMATIETRYDGATAKDVETKITKKIEDAIKEVSGLKDVQSVSKSGFSSILVRADMDNEDEDIVMDDLQKAVESVTGLPSDLREDPKYTEINSAEFPAIELAIIGDNTNRARDIVSDLLKEELEDNKKIKNVRFAGFLKRQFNIRIDYKKMQEHHIGLEEVVQKISMRNVDIPGGEIKSEGRRKLIRVEGKIGSAKELSDIVIRSNFSGQKIYLNQIATVEDSTEDAKFLSSYNGRPATLLVVNKKAGADTIELVDDVNVILERFSKQYEGQFEIKIYNNEADKVKQKLEILSSNAITGLILVVVFLFIFLPGRVGLMASISLPLAVMATIGFMPVLGMNLDAITILALVIALGMLVDNAVVISENFSRIRDEEEISNFDAALKSVKQLWLPITTTGFTTIAAFLPMLVTKGIMGKFIQWIPIVVTISLLLSLIESFFLLPMRLSFSGKPKKNAVTNEVQADWFTKVINKFEELMDKLVKMRYFVLIGFFITMFGSFFLMFGANKFILFPAEQTEIYIGRVEMPRGSDTFTTLEVLNDLSKQIQVELADYQRDVISRAGISSMGPTDPEGATGENHGLITIYASDFAKYNVHYKDFLAKLKNVKSDRAKDVTFKEVINGPPVGTPINATFRSNNTENLNAAINEVKDYLAKIQGISELKVTDVLAEPEIKVLVDYEKADTLGLSVKTIGDALRVALSGAMVSQVTLDNKEIDLNVRYTDSSRKKLEDIEHIKVMDRSGNLVPLMNVAKIVENKGQYEIKRFDYKRSKTLIGQVDGKIINSGKANQALRNYFVNTITTKYNDVSLVFGGEEENTKESMESLGQALILSLMGIFGLLVFLFKSYLRPFIIMTTIPLGLVGFSIAFFLHDKPVSFMAMIGVIGLGGIIVNSGIVLISFIDQLREEGKYDLHTILVKASGMRLRAVFVTSLTTISGLIPTAYGIGGSDAMLVPMTLAMAWGLTSGTVLTLVWVPCAYAILEDFTNFISRYKKSLY